MKSLVEHDYKPVGESKYRRRRRLLISMIAGVSLSSVACMTVAATYIAMRKPWPAEWSWIVLLLSWGALLSVVCLLSDWYASRKEIDRG